MGAVVGVGVERTMASPCSVDLLERQVPCDSKCLSQQTRWEREKVLTITRWTVMN